VLPGEDDDDDDDPDDDPEPLPVEETEPQELSEKEREAQFKKADRAVATYASKIGDIYGDEAVNLIECPLCPPMHKGFLDGRDAGRVPDEVRAATLYFLGIATEVEYEASPQHRLCATCKGLGQVKSGSFVPQWETLTCPACNGCGFTPPPGGAVAAAAPEAGMIAPPTDNGAAPEPGEVDPTGERRLLPDGRQNPNWMKWPQGKILVPPWGITAGLTTQDAA